MSNLIDLIHNTTHEERQQFIIASFTEHYGALMENDPAAWRAKFRKMAQGPFAFYRGSVALYYADVSRDDDPFLNEQTSRVWIQGDLHAANFGTYMNSAGVLVFDVNDFDEAYVGPFTWDVKRLVASLALICYDKAMSDAEIHEVVSQTARGYVRQVARFAAGEDADFGLKLSTTEGKLHEILQEARLLTRVGLLDRETVIVDGDRRFQSNKNTLRVDEATRMKLESTLTEYYETIPLKKRHPEITYRLKDVARRRGLGVGSAGLPMHSLLLEGRTQALENDIILSMKEAQVAAPSLYIPDENIKQYFQNDGHRSAISQRALQTHADPLLGYTTLDGHGVLVSEVSPYTADLDWNEINDLEDMLQVVEYLGRCVAKIHCTSDDSSDQTLVPYSIEAAIHGVLDGREADFVVYMTEFGEKYGSIVRNDHLLFVDAFRNHLFAGL